MAISVVEFQEWGYKIILKSGQNNAVGFRPVISQKAKCEFMTLKHNSMNVYIN